MTKQLRKWAKKTSWGQAYMRHKFWKWTPQDEGACQFYRQFIKPGDVAIDVGANRGSRAKLFIQLQAFAVLVEPQAPCVAYLKTVLRGSPNWVLLESALGSAEGEMEMFIDSNDVMSTLSQEWLSVARQSERFNEVKWDARQKTPVTTLDKIIHKYGAPAFIKIDVEGYEREVLAGLTIPPKAVSFEFNPEFIEQALECVDILSAMAPFEFQVSCGESMVFHSDRWLSGDALKDYVRLKPCSHCGDIYARKIEG